LDELATTSAAVQEKILRIVEYGEFERLGSSKTLRVDVRVIGATNEDLPALAENGRFRADLLDRLSFEVITLPPLRARPEDILILAEHFAIRMSREMGREVFPGFSERAKTQLLKHRWPGNVRELKNTVERAIYRLEEPEQPIVELLFNPFASPFRPATSKSASNQSEQAKTQTIAKQSEPELPINLKKYLQNIEIQWIERALKQQHGNQRRAAKALGLSYDQLRGLLRKYDISS
ncbi:MAG: sigma 54-interacting transcriptional regulator, partial [Pseudomonadota bacterium]